MKSRFLLLAALPMALLAAEPPVPPMPPAPPSPPPAPMQSMAGMSQPISRQVMQDADQLQWGDAPAAFEKGAQMTVLAGDPGQAGPFTVRIKAPAGYKVAPHWHPIDERVTVIEGDFSMRSGDDAAAPWHAFGPGGFMLMPARMHHAARTEHGAVVQVDGMGPFEINYVDAKDDPRLRH